MYHSQSFEFCPLYSEENNMKSEKGKTAICVIVMVELKIYSM